jgi:hypothetical protein
MIKPNARVLKISEQLNFIACSGLNIEALTILIARQTSLNEDKVLEVLSVLESIIEIYLSELNDESSFK